MYRRATLISPEPASEAEDLHLLKDGKTRYTLGSNVSSLFQLRDVDDNESGFFIWPGDCAPPPATLPLYLSPCFTV